MFDAVRTVFGVIKVVEKNNIITVGGIPADVLTQMLNKILETKKITKNIFLNIGKNSFSFYSFYAVEIVYLIDLLKAHLRSYRYTRICTKLVKELNENTWLKTVVADTYTPCIDMNYLRNIKWTLLPHQVEFLQLFSEMVPRYQLLGYLLGAKPGSGKSQPLTTKILTPNGWVLMGSLKVGDVITAWDGTPTYVTGIHPQGVLPRYKITLSDGRCTYASGDHLWKSRQKCAPKDKQWAIRTTLELKEILSKKHDCVHIPCYIPEDETYSVELSDATLVKNIEQVGVSEMQCISVSHPDHLYVCDDYIVTHNTLMDLALAGCIVPREIAEVKIIISPKNAVGLVWADTVKKIFRKQPTYWTSEEKGNAPLGREYYVFHYESMDRALSLAKELAKINIRYFVIIDECHNFNNPTAQRTKNLIELCTMVPNTYSVWASGTPIKAMGTEMIPLLLSIDPKFTKDVVASFKKIFGGDLKAANEMLAHRLGKITFKIGDVQMTANKPIFSKRYIKLQNSDRFLTSSVREEMKEFMVERVKLYQKDMSTYRDMFEECLNAHYATLKTREEKKEYNVYADLVKGMRKVSARGQRPDLQQLAWAKRYEDTKLVPSLSNDMKKKFRKSRSVVKALVMKVQGEALGNILDKRRTECITELALHANIPEIVNDAITKTIVFATRVKPVMTLADALEKIGYEPVRVYADTNKDLTKLITDFTNIPELNPICATFNSLSTAVPVIAANTIVMLDVPPRQFMYDQAVARANRLGQKHQVYVIEIYLDTGNEPNISTRLDEIISWSRDQVAALMGDDFVDVSDDDFTKESYEAIGIDISEGKK